MIQIQPQLLSLENYRNYGDVLSTSPDRESVRVNMGTADRFNYVAQLEDKRPGKAQANVCIFLCNPTLSSPFQIKLLEKHPFSTQMFLRMCGAERYLVIVCLGEDEPDLSTLRVFIASKDQGITYKPGVWHHPLVALDEQTQFACLVWEDGTSGDCRVKELKQPIWTQW